jgi:hypothetical protein
MKPPPLDVESFEQALERLINTYSQENASNTPDFILAQYLSGCLKVWNACVTDREKWYGRTGTTPATIAQQEQLNKKHE